MKFLNTTLGEGKYIAPLCTTTDIVSEGVLCSSMEGLGTEYDYVWGTEE